MFRKVKKIGVIKENTIEEIIKIIKSPQNENYAETLNLILSHIDETSECMIEYSSVLKILKRLVKGTETDPLIEKTDGLKMELLNSKSLTSKEKNLYKILEYISLEIPRISDFNKIDEFSKKTQVNLSETRNKLSEFTNKIDKAQSEFISILAIFAGIIIAFFSGTSLLNNSITAISDKNTNKIILMAILVIIGIIMFNVIYMLLYTISKIINIPIGIKKRNYAKCENCRYMGFRCYAEEYPLPTYYNFVSIYILINLSILYLFDKYQMFTNWSKFICLKFEWFANKEILVLLYIACLLISIAIFICLCLISKNIFGCKKEKKKKENSDSKEINEEDNSNGVSSDLNVPDIMNLDNNDFKLRDKS